MGQIRVDFQRLANGYPMRSSKTSEFGGDLIDAQLRAFMDQIGGTPCCLQVSHALNVAGLPVPQTYPGYRRYNSRIKYKDESGSINDYYYLLAVDEMEKYLTSAYGDGELVSDGKKPDEIKSYLQDRPGILVMRQGWAGVHTELWNGNSFWQKDMNVNGLLSPPKKVLFWDCNMTAPAQWLTDYMRTS